MKGRGGGPRQEGSAVIGPEMAAGSRTWAGRALSRYRAFFVVIKGNFAAVKGTHARETGRGPEIVINKGYATQVLPARPTRDNPAYRAFSNSGGGVKPFEGFFVRREAVSLPRPEAPWAPRVAAVNDGRRRREASLTAVSTVPILKQVGLAGAAARRPLPKRKPVGARTNGAQRRHACDA
jgi:hypothetical protein